MKKATTVLVSFLLIGWSTLGLVEAKGPGAGKNHSRGAAAGGQQGREGLQQRPLQAGAMGAQGRVQGGAMVPNPQTIAQNMLATFDQNGDGALNQAELEVAVAALMQQMRTAMMAAGGQGFGQCAGNGQGMVNQFRGGAGAGQFANRQAGGSRAGAGNARGNHAQKGGRGR